MGDTLPGAAYSKRKTRRGYQTILAVDPHDGQEWDVLVPDSKLAWVASQGRGATLEFVETVRWSLKNIRHLFRGVRDDDREIDDDGWLCYVSTPSKAYDWKRGIQVPPWENELFLVYMTDERVVYHWAWYDIDGEDPHLPIDHDVRFRERVF